MAKVSFLNTKYAIPLIRAQIYYLCFCTIILAISINIYLTPNVFIVKNAV